MGKVKKHKNAKEVDAMVMYACLKLPEIGEATVEIITMITELNDWDVRRSLERLQAFNPPFVALDKVIGSRYSYKIDDEKHITKRGTAWLLERLISLRVSSKDILLEDFINKLKIPKKVSNLQDKDEVKKRIQSLQDFQYID